MRSAGDRNPLSAAQVLENHVLNEGVGAVSAKSHTVQKFNCLHPLFFWSTFVDDVDEITSYTCACPSS